MHRVSLGLMYGLKSHSGARRALSVPAALAQNDDDDDDDDDDGDCSSSGRDSTRCGACARSYKWRSVGAACPSARAFVLSSWGRSIGPRCQYQSRSSRRLLSSRAARALAFSMRGIRARITVAFTVDDMLQCAVASLDTRTIL